MRRLIRRLARLGLLALLVVSLISFGWATVRIVHDPLLRPLIDRTAAGFAAALDREMARTATPEAIAARLTALLAETPRNWIAIQAVEDEAATRSIALPPDLTAIRQAAWDEESGILTVAGACLSCSVNAAACSLSEVLVCNVPVAMTPIGDVIGIGKAGIAAVSGDEIDKLDFALSAIGLCATLATVATGGTSYTLKAGASLLKLARKMSLLPPRLVALLVDVARRGIRWDQAMHWDSLTDPARLIVPEVVAPVAAIAADLGRTNDLLGSTRTLHLLRYVDAPDDARHIADAAESLGPRVVGTLEILGKSRFMRAALRWSDEAAALIAGLLGTLFTLVSALVSALQSLVLRSIRAGLRRAARQSRRPPA